MLGRVWKRRAVSRGGGLSVLPCRSRVRRFVSCDRLVYVDDDVMRDRCDGRRADPASRVSTVLLDVGAAHGGKRGRFARAFSRAGGGSCPRSRLPPAVWKKPWVVHATPTVQGDDLVPRSRARYVHRVAIISPSGCLRTDRPARGGAYVGDGNSSNYDRSPKHHNAGTPRTWT